MFEKYREREYVENHFRLSKQSADGTRLRVWDADVLRGRMFVQFVALCYYEFLAEEVLKIKLTLGNEFDGQDRKTKKQVDLEKKLKHRLNATPLDYYTTFRLLSVKQEINFLAFFCVFML